jgi:hypothetical protein
MLLDIAVLKSFFNLGSLMSVNSLMSIVEDSTIYRMIKLLLLKMHTFLNMMLQDIL